MNRLIAWLAVTLLLGTAQALALKAGQPAPRFLTTSVTGTPFALSDNRDRVVVINFWATWCEPCQAELAAFDAYMQAHKGAPLSIIAVSMDDPEQRFRVERIAQALPFPVAMYGDSSAEDYGRIWRLPITFVIDRDGVLRVDGGRGEQRPYDLPTLERTITPMLAAPEIR